MKMQVKIENWGENCGPKPKPYGSNKEKPAVVVSQGKHLVFTKCGIRTDRCISPNPRISTVSESITSTRWRRTCQTEATDPKFERIEYDLKAVGSNSLKYKSKTKVEWKIKGDHCVAILRESRSFEREGTDPKPKPHDDTPSTESDDPKKPEKLVDTDPPKPGCEEPGPARRLSINPGETTIGPGERVCFKLVGVDEGGCRFPVKAVWTLTQGGQEIGGLLSRAGCFTAGPTAADSEGTYDVLARAEGKSANAAVTVAFPDLDDLARAKLRPADDLEPGQGATATDPATPAAKPTGQGTQPAATPPLPPSPSGSGTSSSRLIVIIIGAVALIAAILLIVVLVMRRRPSRSALDDDDWEDDFVQEQRPPAKKPHTAESGSTPGRARESKPVAQSKPLMCPTCGEFFPSGAQFCPHDAAALIPSTAGRLRTESSPPGGMICPKCHRGYDIGSRFCPHDSEKLVAYVEWRARKKGPK